MNCCIETFLPSFIHIIYMFALVFFKKKKYVYHFKFVCKRYSNAGNTMYFIWRSISKYTIYMYVWWSRIYQVLFKLYLLISRVHVFKKYHNSATKIRIVTAVQKFITNSCVQTVYYNTRMGNTICSNYKLSMQTYM